jgi:hypothetical protein
MKYYAVVTAAWAAMLLALAVLDARAEGVIPTPWGWRPAPCCREFGINGFRGRPPIGWFTSGLAPAIAATTPPYPYPPPPPPVYQAPPVPFAGPVGPPPIMEGPTGPLTEIPPPDAGPPPPPPPLGWVYTRYTVCPEPRVCPVVFASVGADGLNVRAAPDGPPVTSVVNGTPLVVLTRQGRWTLVAPACSLVPLYAWSINANVPLMGCA